MADSIKDHTNNEKPNSAIDTLTRKLGDEHPTVGRDLLSRIMSNHVSKIAASKPENAVDSFIKSGGDLKTLGTAMQAMVADEQTAFVQKLQMACMTAKMLEFVPPAMREKVNSVAGTIGDLHKQQLASAPVQSKESTPAQSKESPTGNSKQAAATMDMLRQVMSSGMLEQIQEMMDDDPSEDVISQVDLLTKKVELLDARLTRLEPKTSAGKRSARRAR